MRVLVEKIWWFVKKGADVTHLPLSAVVTVDEEDIMDQDEFNEAVEDELETKYNVRPQGFHYEILTETLQ